MDGSEERRLHEQIDPHRRASWLSDVILGGQDGLVNVLGVVLGVAATGAPTRVVIGAGLAATCAESVSMAAVAYTSTRAQGELFDAERAREYRHVATVPGLERQEVRAIYEAKGFRGELLDRIVETITRDRDVWVAVMMTEEHGLTPFEWKASLRSAVLVGISAAIGSLVPLLPVFFLPRVLGMWGAVVAGAAALFLFGLYKGRLTHGRHLRSGLELAVIGTVSAMAGYAIGLFFEA
jgi:VIT1/CCC1 family predicted Fe2+/Mn2+ transporter